MALLSGENFEASMKMMLVSEWFTVYYTSHPWVTYALLDPQCLDIEATLH